MRRIRLATALAMLALVGSATIGAQSASAIVLVTTLNAGPFQYRTATYHETGPGDFSVFVGCSSGYHATGGGGIPAAGSYITTMRPADTTMSPNADSSDRFDLGGHSSTSGNYDVKITTICLKTCSSALNYADHELTYGTSAVGFGDSVTCSGDLVGGGVQMGGADQSKNSLWRTVPSGSDTWGYTGFKQTTSDSPIYEVSAVCAPSGTHHVRVVKKEAVLDEGATKTLTVHCPSGHVAAGGLDATFATILKSTPFDSNDAGRAPDDGWTATVHGSPSYFGAFRVQAICVS